MTQQSHSYAYNLRKAKLKNTHVSHVFIAALFTISVYYNRTWKQPRYPLTSEWRKKLWYIYTMEDYSTIKRNAFESVIMRQMNLEPIIQSEVSQTKNDKYHILMDIHGIYKNGTEEFIYRATMEKQTQRIGLWMWEEERVRYIERITWKLTLPCVKQPMGICCTAQGTQIGSL